MRAVKGVPWKGRSPARPALAAVGVLVSLGMAACGSSGGSTSAESSAGSGSSSGVSAAAASLAKYTGVTSITAPGPAFNASKAQGKLVELVTQKAANPAVATVAAGLKAGLTHVGVQVQSCDAQGVSVQISNCIRQGLSQHAAAIDVVGGDPKAYSAGLAAAQAANVPVFSSLDVPLPAGVQASGVNSSALTADLKGLAGDAAPPDALSGTLAADFVTKDSGGKATVLFIASPGIVGSDYLQKAFVHQMSKICPSCSVDLKAVTITNWASDLGPVVSAALAKNPKINYVVPVFDPMTAYTDPAIQQAGKAGTVKVVTANGSLQQMRQLAQHDPVLVCEVGQDLTQLGYISADQTLRKLAGVSAVPNSAAQVRVFTSANIGSLTVSSGAFSTGQWYTGSASKLADTYDSLWSAAA